METWDFIVKWQSSVTPRFLTESDKAADALPTAIESGKEKEKDLDFRPEDTIIASVLSSFSSSLHPDMLHARQSFQWMHKVKTKG